MTDRYRIAYKCDLSPLTAYLSKHRQGWTTKPELARSFEASDYFNAMMDAGADLHPDKLSNLVSLTFERVPEPVTGLNEGPYMEGCMDCGKIRSKCKCPAYVDQKELKRRAGAG